MKNKIKPLFLFSIFFYAFSSHAQESIAEKNLKETLEVFRMTLVNPTRQNLDILTNDKLDYWHSSGKHENKNEFMLTLLSGKSDFVNLTFEDQQITIHENTAIVHHILEGDTNDSGKSGHVKIGNMLIWQKSGEQWKLIARQAYKLPVEATAAK